jgi:hypothetical protein
MAQEILVIGPVSRQGAKYAKSAKKTKGFCLAILCALASWRELF